MMEWTVVTVLIALVGLLAALVKPIVSLTKSITKLTVVVERVQGDVETMTTHNTEAHRRIWEHNDEQDGKLNDHETRITMIEHKV